MSKKGRPKVMENPYKFSLSLDKTMKSDMKSFCMINGKTQAQFMREAIAEKLKNKKEQV